MNWKPNKWIAASLGFFLQLFGLLYVGRVKWALFYLFIGALSYASDDYFLNKVTIQWFEYFSFNYGLMFVCAIHSYRISVYGDALEKRPWYSHWYGLLGIPITVFFVIFNFRAFLYEPFRMSAASMTPSMNTGETIITSKWGYGNYGTYGITVIKRPLSKIIKRGDIMVFEYPQNTSISYVKRIIGIPGDRVEYRNKEVIINGNPIYRRKIRESGKYFIYQESIDGSSYNIAIIPMRPSNIFHFNVPKDQYLVLGDNRDNSRDSRDWGMVPMENMIGKVVHVFN